MDQVEQWPFAHNLPRADSADFSTQIDQHDNEPRTRKRGSTGRHSNIYELSDFEKQKSRRNAAKIQTAKPLPFVALVVLEGIK